MIKTAIYNETHLNISCETFGAHPSPKLKILINGLELEGETNYASNYHENPWTSHHLLMSNPKNSSLFECEIEIPEVNCKQAEKLFYHSCVKKSSNLIISYVNNTNSCTKFCC